MPLSNASRLADFGTGIGTAGAIIQVDNANQRLGVGTTAPTATLGVAGIVSATAFYGDGSNLDGVASAGLGTALSEEEFNPLTVIYQTSDTLSVGATITVDPPDATTKVAYTQYAEVKLEGDADLIVADGDDFIPDILGLSTEGFSFSNANGNGVFDTVYTDNIENAAGRGAPNFPLGITVTGISTLSGNVSIGGTLTYEDVTNVDSIGVVTARSGIDITGASAGVNGSSNLILKVDGGEKVRITSAGLVGVGTDNPASELHVMQSKSGGSSHASSQLTLERDGTNYLQFMTANNGTSGLLFGDVADNDGTAIKYDHNTSLMLFNTEASERLRIGPAGQIGIAGANYGTAGQVLSSQGSGAAPQWATPASGGLTEWDQWSFVNNISNLGQNMSTPQDLGSGSMGVIWQRINTSQNPGFEKIGVGMTHSSGVFTFPSVGKYEVSCHVQFRSWDQGRSGLRLALFTSADGGSSWHGSSPSGTYYMEEATSNSSYSYATLNVDGFINVDNTTNKVCKFVVSHNGENSAQIGIFGSASTVRTNCIFRKLN